MLLDEAAAQCVGTTFGRTETGLVTAELKIRFRRTLPTPAVVLCRSWVEREEGCCCGGGMELKEKEICGRKREARLRLHAMGSQQARPLSLTFSSGREPAYGMISILLKANKRRSD